jgi:hypothetical protein
MAKRVRIVIVNVHARRPADTSVYPRVDRRGWKVPARDRSTFRCSVGIRALSRDRVVVPETTGSGGATVANGPPAFCGPIVCAGGPARFVRTIACEHHRSTGGDGHAHFKTCLPMMRLFTARILKPIRSVSGLLAATPTSTCVFRSHLVVACSAFHSYLLTAKRSPR